MYPIFETERLVLRPLQEGDLDNMFKIVSDPTVIAGMEWELINDLSVYKKEFIEQVNSGAYWSIRKKKGDNFIGFFILLNYIDKKKYKVKYSQLCTALLPKYWSKGFCTEVTKKYCILHFWELERHGFVQINSVQTLLLAKFCKNVDLTTMQLTK